MTNTMFEAGQTLIRDLPDAEFAARYDCDRFTAAVLSNRLSYAVQHVVTGLLHRAFSPIISLAADFAACICAPPEQEYEMSAVTSGLSVFLGTMSHGVRVAVEEYGADRLKPGDLIVCNDVYRIGNHPNDVCFIRPIFHDDRLGGFMVIRAHLLDVGGSVPGGFSGSKRSVYENGLVISPRLIYSEGKPVRETFSLIFDNVRFGETMLPDFHTLYNCCTLGEQLIQETIETYGFEAYLGSLRYACDVSAESMGRAILAFPDGDYEGAASVDADGVDAEEEFKVHLRMRKRGTAVEVDFSGSSRQARTSINAGPLDTKTAVGVVLKMLLDPEGTFTSGTFRNIDVVIPPGTITSALPPDGAIFTYWEVEGVILTILLKALEEALGDRAIGGDFGSSNTHNAFGVRPDGRPWSAAALLGANNGAWGGTAEADGDSCSTPSLMNLMAPATENLEADFPVRIMRREYVPDTAGAGAHRGGTSLLRDIQYTEEAGHQTMPLRFRHPSGVGVNGGHDGRPGGVWIFDQGGGALSGAEAVVPTVEGAYRGATPVAGVFDPETKLPSPDGEYAYFAAQPVWRTGAGATWRYVTNAGGGWGDPFRRDPELVKRDVRDGYATIEGAAAQYGVVILGDPHSDPEGLEIDAEATARLRAGS